MKIDLTSYWLWTSRLSLLMVVVFVAVGYLLTPWLFSQYSEREAGELAGLWFNAVGWSGVFLISSWLLLAWRKTWLSFKTHFVGALVLLLLLVLLLYIAPEMAQLKALNTMQNLRESPLWPRFAMLHGIYQLGYLIVIAMLIVELWLSRKKRVILRAKR